MSDVYGIFSVPAGLEAAAGTLDEVRAAVARALPTEDWTGAGADTYGNAVALLLEQVSTVNGALYGALAAVRTAEALAVAEIAGRTA